MKLRTPHRCQIDNRPAVPLPQDADFGTQARPALNVILYSRNAAIGLKVLYCLHHAGARVWVIAARASSYLRYSRYRHSFEAIEEPAAERHRALLAERINALADQRTFDAVLADDISSHALLHDLRGAVQVPVFAPSPSALLTTCHDKWSFYSTLLAQGLPVPPSLKLADLQDLTEEKVSGIGFPLLVKPLNGESGHGIRRFEDYQGLRRYLATPGPYKTLPLKLQRFIVGSTVGLSLLAQHGEIVCHDVQRHTPDGARSFEHHPAALAIGRRIVALFGYGGPGHIDFIEESESGKLYALEFNCRYWYSLPVSLWRGGNFPAMAVELARGRPVPLSPTRPGRYFQPGAVIAMARRPWQLTRLDAANWHGFAQAISDPLPHLLSRMRQ